MKQYVQCLNGHVYELPLPADFNKDDPNCPDCGMVWFHVWVKGDEK